MRIKRSDWDPYFMLHAHLYATRSTCDRGPELLFDPGRHGVGSVLVKNNMIVAGGYNGSAPGQPHCDEEDHIYVDGHCVRTIHAEMNAILQCAKIGVSCDGCTLYTTASLCWDCSKAIVRAGIKRVVFGSLYESRYGLSGIAKDFLASCDIQYYCLPKEKLGITPTVKLDT